MAAALATAWRAAGQGRWSAARRRALASDAPGGDNWSLVSIDRSGLAGEGRMDGEVGGGAGGDVGSPPAGEPTPLMKHIQALIKVIQRGDERRGPARQRDSETTPPPPPPPPSSGAAL